jgi:diguanylate cyclase (GGDEF)-like protein
MMRNVAGTDAASRIRGPPDMWARPMSPTATYHIIRWGTLAAAAVLCFAAVRAEPVPPLLLLAGLAVLCLAAESGNLTLPHAGSVSFGAVATLPAILVIGPGYAALCGALGQIGSHLRVRRPGATVVFNASQRAVSLVVAGVVWTLVGSGQLSLGPVLSRTLPERVLPAAVACIAAYTLATHVLVSVYSATRRARPIRTVLLGNASIRFAATPALGAFGLLLALVVVNVPTAPDDVAYVLLLPAAAGAVFLFHDAHRQMTGQIGRLYSAVTNLVDATDLEHLLQRFADLVERLATPAGLWVALRSGGGRYEVAVARGLDLARAQRLAETVAQEVWGPRPNAIAQFARVDDYMRRRPDPPRLASGEPIRSVVLAPLAAGPDLVGVLGMVHPIADYFIPAQDRPVQMLTIQAALVVNYLRLYRESQDNLARAEALQRRNAELLHDSQRRAHQLALLNRAFMRVATSLAAGDVFAALVEELHSSLGYPRVSLRLLEGDMLRLVADRGYTAGALEQIPVTEGIVGRVARTGQPALVLDVRRDPDYVVTHPMVTQLASAPISNRGTVAGVITVESVEPVLGTSDLELLTTLAGYAALVIENARNFEEARTLATTDGLTGLANRRMLWSVFERELARAVRYNTPLSVVMVEVDRFKHYNDTHGHLRGDGALRRVARVLVREHRANVDTVARYGGDEFVTLLPQTGKAEAAAVAERIRRAVAGAVSGAAVSDGGPDAARGPLLTVSVGVAAFPEDGRTIEVLLRAADRSMYEVKAAGGDAVAVAPGAAR